MSLVYKKSPAQNPHKGPESKLDREKLLEFPKRLIALSQMEHIVYLTVQSIQIAFLFLGKAVLEYFR